MLPVMSAVHLKMNVAVITLPKPKNSIHIDVAHHNQNSIHIDVAHHNTHVEVAHHNAHIDIAHHNTHVKVAHHNTHVEVAHHNTHVEVAHHNHIDINYNNTHINIHIVVTHPDVRIHLAIRLIVNANLPLSHLLDQAHIRAHHSIAHLDPPPDPHLEEDLHLKEDPQHKVILLFIDY